MKKIKLLFNKIKEGHPYWVKGDLNYKERLERAFEPIFQELETLGVARHFAEALLFFGKEFVDSVVLDSKTRKEATVEDAEAIFGGKAVEMSPLEKKEAEIAEKHGALVYLHLGGETPKIEILSYKSSGAKEVQPVRAVAKTQNLL